MKKILTYLFALLLLMACAPEPVEYKPQFKLPANAFQPIDESDVDFDKEIPAMPSLPGSDVVAANDTTGEVLKASSLTAAAMVQSLLGTLNTRRTHQVSGTYRSIDWNGDSITLSGKIILPVGVPVRNIILVSHYTIGANFEAPSQCFPLEGILAGQGYAVVVADYIGFGVTRELPHPYMAGELTAKNVVDLYFAALPYLQSIDKMPQDPAIYLMGYSQGGAITITVQYIFERDYRQVKIRRNFAGAGPYDLAATYDKWMADDITGIPCAVPMIIQGMNVAENLNLDYSIFFKPNLLETYDEYINSKNYTVKQIGMLMGVNKLSEIVTDECRDKRTESSFKLYRALMRNSIAYLWWPEAPLYMFHSQDDDTVPFENSQKARDQWKDCNIEYNFGHYGNHMMGCLTFLGIVNRLVK